MGWTKRWRKRLRALFRKEAVDRELDEELAFHLEMETRKYLAEGLRPEEARRRAALAFGGVEKHKEEVRDARWLAWAPGLSLDLRLGLRMLVKHPGLTRVGGLGMAVALRRRPRGGRAGDAARRRGAAFRCSCTRSCRSTARWASSRSGCASGGLALALLTLSVLLLSGAGIYALMSLTVTQRRREIGIRSALGALRDD